MKCQPNRNYVSCDDVQTPQELANAVIAHFNPTGQLLEPCRGDGSFYRAMEEHLQTHRQDQCDYVTWREIKDGRDFFHGEDPPCPQFDWCVTNPPWSLFRQFLQRSMLMANNIVFLVTVNHAWTKARIRDVREAGFGIKEILLCDMPKSFPQSGFQLGAIHWQRGWTGDIKLSRLP